MKLNPELTTGIERECQIITSRSGGPGGQNVNKVETRVQLRWNMTETTLLSPDIKTRISELAGNRLSQDRTILTIQSNRYRSQLKNKEDAFNRLFSLIEEAMTPPEIRFQTKPTAGSKADRLKGKKQRSLIKSYRKPIQDSGEH